MLSYAVGNLRINGLRTKREKQSRQARERKQLSVGRFQNWRLRTYFALLIIINIRKKHILPVWNPGLLPKVLILNFKSLSFRCHRIKRQFKQLYKLHSRILYSWRFPNITAIQVHFNVECRAQLSMSVDSIFPDTLNHLKKYSQWQTEAINHTYISACSTELLSLCFLCEVECQKRHKKQQKTCTTVSLLFPFVSSWV